MDKSKVCIVIVAWNSAKDIEICLDSLRAVKYENMRIIVVDNGSADNTAEIIKSKYSDLVDLVSLPINLFLSPGNNVGIKHAIKEYSPEFVMVLNPDTKVEPNLVEALLEPMRDQSVGAVGPLIKFFNNKNEGLVNSAGLKFDGFKQAYDIGFEEKDTGQFMNDREVFGITGTCILYRVKMLNEIGLYWEKIKLYMDETEMFIRMSKTKWKAVFTPKTTVWHSYMKSSDQHKIEKINAMRDKAWLWIALRHYPLMSKLAMVKQYFLK
jgi:GT2 family glycosyltransferase